MASLPPLSIFHYVFYLIVHPQNDKNSNSESSSDFNVVGIAIFIVLLVIAIICNTVQAVLYYKLKKKKLQSEIVTKWVIVQCVQPIPAACCYYSNVRQAMQREYKSDEVAYEIMDKSGDVEMDKNPAYTAQEETSMDNEYVNVPTRQAKVKQWLL